MATTLDGRSVTYKDVRHVRTRKIRMEERLLSMITVLTLVCLEYLLFLLDVALSSRSAEDNGNIEKLSLKLTVLKEVSG